MSILAVGYLLSAMAVAGAVEISEMSVGQDKEIVRGSFKDIKRVETAARRCGIREVAVAVPDGFDNPTYIMISKADLRSPKGKCLAQWKRTFKPRKMVWKW